MRPYWIRMAAGLSPGPMRRIISGLTFVMREKRDGEKVLSCSTFKSLDGAEAITSTSRPCFNSSSTRSDEDEPQPQSLDG